MTLKKCWVLKEEIKNLFSKLVYNTSADEAIVFEWQNKRKKLSVSQIIYKWCYTSQPSILHPQVVCFALPFWEGV